MAAGQAGACLYQADLLRDLDEGEGVGPDAIKQLRWATDLSHRATKETAQAIGQSLAALVAMERHLWLNLSGTKEKDKSFLLDTGAAFTYGSFRDCWDNMIPFGLL